ncbi:hypothetical protein QDT91_28470 (plasmid) [Mycolicibacterium aubagnense]|uniref:hypothetical protein n=1 Tax=Mycolicibacterium aubagnense TaxID=319707 RepID=UPI0013F63124|nr:hypothetical protein [Mycolicibacterium aubagnense]WGI35944.1 hypothetical protein QDT91_28470 [Mycolicibacterium aubagnense]
MMRRRNSANPPIDHTVMASYRSHPVNLYLAGGHVITGGVVRHIGTETVECLSNHGAVTVALRAIEAVESLVPESASAEFPRPEQDRTDV